jgi:hypothetical protein
VVGVLYVAHISAHDSARGLRCCTCVGPPGQLTYLCSPVSSQFHILTSSRIHSTHFRVQMRSRPCSGHCKSPPRYCRKVSAADRVERVDQHIHQRYRSMGPREPPWRSSRWMPETIDRARGCFPGVLDAPADRGRQQKPRTHCRGLPLPLDDQPEEVGSPRGRKPRPRS